MNLSYKCKKSSSDYCGIAATQISGLNGSDQSLLIHGPNADCLRALLQHHAYTGKVDLVYVDPPFATNTVFRVGKNRTATISSSAGDRVAYSDTLQGEHFIEFIRERIILLREIMSDVASIYLHIDYKIGHYVKVIMDEIFGVDNFRNDITRIKCNPKNFSRRGYGNIKDLVLFYSKTKEFIWNEPRVAINSSDIERLYSKVDNQGRRYTTVPVHAPGETVNGPTSREWRGMLPPKGRHWRSDPKELDLLDKNGLIEWSKAGNPRKINFADDAVSRGKKLQDLWEFKDDQYPEYPTQKNLSMLETIVAASSKPNSLVLDCFCGSGTTLVAAEKLGRQWIGIDESDAAIEVAKRRLGDIGGMFGHGMLELRYADPKADGLKSGPLESGKSTFLHI